MRTAETSISTVTWWSRLASACTITTRPPAVPLAHAWPTDSQFTGAAASTLYKAPRAPRPPKKITQRGWAT